MAYQIKQNISQFPPLFFLQYPGISTLIPIPDGEGVKYIQSLTCLAFTGEVLYSVLLTIMRITLIVPGRCYDKP